MSIYDFKVKSQSGSEVMLSDYKGKVLLIVNTATECGFTPQYTQLQEIYNEFHDEGLALSCGKLVFAVSLESCLRLTGGKTALRAAKLVENLFFVFEIILHKTLLYIFFYYR